MNYNDRLREYEREKRKLQAAGLSWKEYEIAIRKLADKLRI